MNATLTAVRPPTNETEERLLDEALTLFAEKGYEATSVREIIEAAGVTRPVLYYYCTNKEDLFKRIVHWKHDAAYRELEQTLGSTQGCAEQLQAIITGSFAYCAQDPRVPQLMFQTHFGPVIPELATFMAEMAQVRFAIVERVMAAGLAAGELAGGDAASLALIFCCVMDQHINILSRLPRAADRLTPTLATEIVNAFLYGTGRGPRGLVNLPPFAAVV